VLTTAKAKARWDQHGSARGINIIKALSFAELLSARKTQVIIQDISFWTYSLNLLSLI
jgi:hypothetical protein